MSPLLTVCVYACVFAGTTERVCLIQGTVEALNGVHDFIAEKVREMPQSTQKTEPVSILQPQTTVNPDRVKQVRLFSLSYVFNGKKRFICNFSPTKDRNDGYLQ